MLDAPLQKMKNMPRFIPAFASALIGGLLLLFISELPAPLKRYLIPSIFIYAIGASLIGTFHRFLAFRYMPKNGGGEYRSNEQPIPRVWRCLIDVCHILWFGGLVAYNVWRGIL